MELKVYNDNELIYLIKLNNESAWIMLVNKYRKFIYQKIYEYDLKNVDDCFQEGIICLYNATKTFNNSYNKSFMKYFEGILIHKLLDIKKVQEKEKEIYTYDMDLDNFLVLNEDEIKFSDELIISDNFLSKLTEMERIVFDDYYINNLSIKEIAIKNNLKNKNIYYAIYRIKGKIKKYVVK